MQVATLETIAKTRHLGALQSNLATQMNITNANFFYVVKVGLRWKPPQTGTSFPVLCMFNGN